MLRFALILLAASAAAQDPGGWGSFRWGMRPAEAFAAKPANMKVAGFPPEGPAPSRPPSTPLSFSLDGPGEPDPALGAVVESVTLTFGSSGLQEIALLLGPPEGRSQRETVDAVLVKLSRRYGSPYLEDRIYAWLVGRTDIQFAPQAAGPTLTYRHRAYRRR